MIIKKEKNTYVIIAVKDGEEYIEGLLRTTIFKTLYGKEDLIKQILVLDLNSKDKTKDIIKRFETECECVKLVDWKECEKILNIT